MTRDRDPRRTRPRAPQADRSAARRRTPAGSWRTYLGADRLPRLSAFPLYWMFVIATEHRRGAGADPADGAARRQAS